jgi:hypothetical protein
MSRSPLSSAKLLKVLHAVGSIAQAEVQRFLENKPEFPKDMAGRQNHGL